MLTKITTGLLLFSLLLLTGCSTSTKSPDSSLSVAAKTLEAVRTKVTDNASHRYRYVAFWDNRFAKSTYRESMSINYSVLEDSERGFGFHAAHTDYEVLYDGQDELKIDHQKRKVVRKTAAEIAADSAYFDHKMYFMANPRELPEMAAFDRVSDTIVAGKKLWTYRLTSYTPSVADPNKIVVAARIYFLDPATDLLERVLNISHVDHDTIQTIDYQFSDFKFQADAYHFGERDRASSLSYRELTSSANERERLAGLVRPGDQLYRADYPDIQEEKQSLYGQNGETTVVMFSFIGCGGCEYALREMKQKSYAFGEHLNFYYSSPVDNAAAVQSYLSKKQFPHQAFSKESKMNDNFHVAAFPTFVVINENGKVERVIGGYDEEMEELLFLGKGD